jgi:hypothetical protein
MMPQRPVSGLACPLAQQSDCSHMGFSLARGVSAALSMVAVNLEQPSEFGAHQHLLDILHTFDEIQYRGVRPSPDKRIYYNYRYGELPAGLQYGEKSMIAGGKLAENRTFPVRSPCMSWLGRP